MQCILYKIYFWKVFHMYYNWICILYVLLLAQNFILVKSGCYNVHGADRTRRHPISRSPGHRVPNLCAHPRSSAPGLLLLPQSSSMHAMPHLPPTHHETSKHDSPNETKIKEKQNKTIPDSNSNFAKSITHHNQTK
jgi:hypothetical protein